MYYIIFYYIKLYYIILHIVLYYLLLYYIILYYIILYIYYIHIYIYWGRSQSMNWEFLAGNPLNSQPFFSEERRPRALNTAAVIGVPEEHHEAAKTHMGREMLC